VSNRRELHGNSILTYYAMISRKKNLFFSGAKTDVVVGSQSGPLPEIDISDVMRNGYTAAKARHTIRGPMRALFRAWKQPFPTKLCTEYFWIMKFCMSVKIMAASIFEFRGKKLTVLCYFCSGFHTTRRQINRKIRYVAIFSSLPKNVWRNVYLYTAHITSCLMAVYNSTEWDRTSAIEGAPGCRCQSIFYLAHPPNLCMKCEMKLEIDHHTGNFVPYSFQQVRGFFNVPC